MSLIYRNRLSSGMLTAPRSCLIVRLRATATTQTSRPILEHNQSGGSDNLQRLAGGTPVTARQGRQALDANEQHDPSLDQRDQRDQSTLITDSSGLMEGQFVQRQRVLVKRHLQEAGIRGNTLIGHSSDQDACEQQDYQHALGPPEQTVGSTRSNIAHSLVTVPQEHRNQRKT
jgi:hypothetical protein